MIRTSFCTIAFQKKKWGDDRVIERPLAELLPIVADAGYDGVEIWDPHVADMDASQLAEVRSQLDELNLSVPMLSPYFNFTESEETAAQSVRDGLAVLDRARLLGARAIRCFTGRVGSADADEDQWSRTAASLQTLADASADDGIGWCLETHGRNLTDTIDSNLRLLEMTARTNVRLIFQPSTFGEDHLRATDALAAHAAHVHGNDYGGDKIDWPAVVARLNEVGFDGYFSVEWMGESSPEEAARNESAALSKLLG